MLLPSSKKSGHHETVMGDLHLSEAFEWGDPGKGSDKDMLAYLGYDAEHPPRVPAADDRGASHIYVSVKRK